MSSSQSHFYRALERAQRHLAAAPDAGPAGADPLARARRLHALMDRIAEEGAEESAAGRAAAGGFACRAGCSHCCRHPVGVTFGEALALREALAALPRAGREALSEHVSAAAAATAAVPWADLAGLACPLLQDGRCSLYAARPLPCRALLSADAEACAAPERHGGVPFDRPAFLSGLALGQVLAGTGGHRELRSALAAVLAAADPAPAFAAARPAGGP